MKTTKRLATLLICLSVGMAMTAQSDKRLRYDKESDLEGIEMEPQLLSMHENYDPMDHGTWPVFSTPCVAAVAPKSGDLVESTALWCTKNATYLFFIYKVHWDAMYFTSSSTEFIRDSKTGKKFYAKEHIGAPLDVNYWIKGREGDYIYSVSIFPPLPKTCTLIDIGQETHPETAPGTTGWSKSETVTNIPVSQLQANQYKITGRK